MTPKEMEDMMLWFKRERLKDNQDIKKSKSEIIDSILQSEPNKIRNTVSHNKTYTLWQRIKKVLWMS